MLDFDIISSELRAGRPILVFDQKDREGETDIFFSAMNILTFLGLLAISLLYNFIYFLSPAFLLFT